VVGVVFAVLLLGQIAGVFLSLARPPLAVPDRIVAVGWIVILAMFATFLKQQNQRVYGIIEFWFGVVVCWRLLGPRLTANLADDAIAVIGGIYLVGRGFNNYAEADLKARFPRGFLRYLASGFIPRYRTPTDLPFFAVTSETSPAANPNSAVERQATKPQEDNDALYENLKARLDAAEGAIEREQQRYRNPPE
jgi:hypothetical protein